MIAFDGAVPPRPDPGVDLLVEIGYRAGTEPHAYYDVLQWLMFRWPGQAHHFHASASERGLPREKYDYGDQRCTNEANRFYSVMNRRLARREWIAADRYTVADMVLLPRGGPGET